MASHGVKTLIYSSTCATYGEPEKMPIIETTPQVVTLKLAYRSAGGYFTNGIILFHLRIAEKANPGLLIKCFIIYVRYYWSHVTCHIFHIFVVLYS
jgi:hypothetical protein